MKILLIHATAGAGHKKAAEAIYNGLLRHSTHHVQIIDSLDYTNPFFKKTYPAAYVFFVTKAPGLWGFFFWLVGLPFLLPLVRLVRRIYHAINAGPLVKFLKEGKFDVVITTHFMSAEISAYLKRTGQIQSKVICTVTDFDVHPIWINNGVDMYTGASEFTKKRIESFGISADRVFVTGIPTDEKFAVNVEKFQMRQQLKIQSDLFTVLLATGSFGMGPLEELIEVLKGGYQLLVVCGHNRQVYDKLKSRANDRVHIFGLVNNMDELMSAADVMVTKPGGLSIAEALVKRLPMLFFSAIPGQETGNIDVLIKYEAASEQGGVMDIVNKLDDLSANPQAYETLRGKLGVLSKPNAVKDIISLIA